MKNLIFTIIEKQYLIKNKFDEIWLIFDCQKNCTDFKIFKDGVIIPFSFSEEEIKEKEKKMEKQKKRLIDFLIKTFKIPEQAKINYIEIRIHKEKTETEIFFYFELDGKKQRYSRNLSFWDLTFTK